MSKVLILVEGQTEETFVRECIGPYFYGKGVYFVAKVLTTSTTRSGPDCKGGVTSYGKIKRDLPRLLRDSSAACVTTMIDFYGLPKDFPGKKDSPGGSCYNRVRQSQRHRHNGG